MRSIIIRERIDVVHCHQAFSTLANEAAFHARTMGLPVVFTDHSLFGFADASSILLNKALKFSLADVHSVICVSHVSRANTILRACVPPQRVCVIPNAVDASRFRPRSVPSHGAEDQSHHPCSLSDSDEPDLTVVVMSRLVYRKGIDLLAVVLPALCDRFPTANFLVGGDGPKRALLSHVVSTAGLEDRVTLLGAIPPDKVRDVLVRGHIFLNCSLTEAFCIAIVEAASTGLLTVSTRVGGVPEVLPPEMLLLADPSPEGIVDAMEEAVARVKDRRKRGDDAVVQHERVRGMYSWHAVAARTAQVYAEVVASERDDSMTGRLRRYSRCGKWFGMLCCCLAAIDWMYLKWLEWRWPDSCIERAVDLPGFFPA